MIALALGLTRGAGETIAGEVLPGPVPARIVRVLDGDTVIARARIWLGQEVEIRVRIAGIDAPEIHGKCAAERRRARRAGAFVRARINDGAVRLADVRYGKFAGRVVARIVTGDGVDLAAALIAAGLARAYDGRRRASWCGAAARAMP